MVCLSRGNICGISFRIYGEHRMVMGKKQLYSNFRLRFHFFFYFPTLPFHLLRFSTGFFFYDYYYLKLWRTLPHYNFIVANAKILTVLCWELHLSSRPHIAYELLHYTGESHGLNSFTDDNGIKNEFENYPTFDPSYLDFTIKTMYYMLKLLNECSYT